MNSRCVSAPHDGMRRRRRESHGWRGLARSGRVVGPREGDGSSVDARLVALASINLGVGWLLPLQMGKRVSERATRGGEGRSAAVSGHRIHAVRLGKPSEPVRTRRLRSLGALACSAARRLGESAPRWPAGPVSQGKKLLRKKPFRFLGCADGRHGERCQFRTERSVNVSRKPKNGLKTEIRENAAFLAFLPVLRFAWVLRSKIGKTQTGNTQTGKTQNRKLD